MSTRVIEVSLKKIYLGKKYYVPGENFSLFGGYPQIVTSEVGKHGGFNVPRGSPYNGTEISLISVEMTETFEVDRKHFAPKLSLFPEIDFPHILAHGRGCPPGSLG